MGIKNLHIGYWDKMRFDEVGVVGTGFYTIAESTLDYREDGFNFPSLTV